MELGLTIPFLSRPPALVSEQSKLYLIPSKETYPAILIMEVADWNESGKEEAADQSIFPSCELYRFTIYLSNGGQGIT